MHNGLRCVLNPPEILESARFRRGERVWRGAVEIVRQYAGDAVVS
jgi:hypothetical protein